MVRFFHFHFSHFARRLFSHYLTKSFYWKIIELPDWRVSQTPCQFLYIYGRAETESPSLLDLLIKWNLGQRVLISYSGGSKHSKMKSEVVDYACFFFSRFQGYGLFSFGVFTFTLVVLITNFKVCLKKSHERPHFFLFQL